MDPLLWKLPRPSILIQTSWSKHPALTVAGVVIVAKIVEMALSAFEDSFHKLWERSPSRLAG